MIYMNFSLGYRIHDCINDCLDFIIEDYIYYRRIHDCINDCLDFIIEDYIYYRRIHVCNIYRQQQINIMLMFPENTVMNKGQITHWV